IVDDYRHAIFIFSNDGKRLLQTIGEPNVHAADDKHFYRPTFIAWLPDSTFFVADGYANTRVVKFDKNGKFLMTWGQKGTPPEKRPGYFNNVHGVAVDAQTRRVFVNDRQNHRVQVFDQNGKYLNEWSFGPPPSDIHLFIISADRYLWAFDRGTSKMLKYDLDGNFLYSWGTWGDFPGGFWGVHGLAVDQAGNFYVAEVDSGRAQKYRPRPGANPAFLVGKPVYSACLVIAVFMLGLGVGSFVAGAWADRSYAEPGRSLLRAYGCFELLIGVMGVGISVLLPHLSQVSSLVSSYSRGPAGWYVLS